MRYALLLTVCLGLLVACGGGGTGGPSGPDVVKIESNDVDPLSPTYRAVFDCTATFRVSGTALPITVDGTLTIENEGVMVTHPVYSSREGWKVKNTLVLIVPASIRAQIPTLPETITVVVREYVEVAVDGSWYSLGGDAEDPTTDPVETYQSWFDLPLLNLQPTMFAGQTFTSGPSDVLNETATETLAWRQNLRTVAQETENVNTPLGLLECYRATVIETVTPNVTEPQATEILYERWERPDMGLIRMHAEGYEITVDNDGTPVTITLDSLDCTLLSLEG